MSVLSFLLNYKNLYLLAHIKANSIARFRTRKIASEMPVPDNLGKYFFNTMRYRSGETVQRSGYFQSSVSYIKVHIMFK